MSENTAPARCSEAEYEAARKAGILIVTAQNEAAVHAFAEAIRAEARASVAELIEVANRAAIAAVRGDDNQPGTIRNQDLDALRAALARVKGA
jgi:hypothetical protein